MKLLHNESQKEILEYIEKENPKYIIRSEDGIISQDVIDRLSSRLIKILETGIYTVYQLTKG
ncbi:MAG: hypothetical protein NTX47_02835 [Candidatus Omnitrophica bacterium]|nr:hypothetical protein [Candidatus Omnitrophota bacterium]